MASPKNPSTRPAASIATAAQKTRSAIEDLQSRITEVSQHGGIGRLSSVLTAEREPETAIGAQAQEHSGTSETEAELERQLEAYFASGGVKEGSATGPPGGSRHLDDLRKRVVDGVVKRILADWSSTGPGASNPLWDEVMERLIERVFQQFQAGRAVEDDALSS
jgi:hypothetical protein